MCTTCILFCHYNEWHQIRSRTHLYDSFLILSICPKTPLSVSATFPSQMTCLNYFCLFFHPLPTLRGPHVLLVNSNKNVHGSPMHWTGMLKDTKASNVERLQSRCLKIEDGFINKWRDDALLVSQWSSFQLIMKLSRSLNRDEDLVPNNGRMSMPLPWCLWYVLAWLVL